MIAYMLKKLEVGLFAANCYIYSADLDELIIIDPGGDPQKIIQSLPQQGKGLKYILFTHGHLDHIAASSHLLDYCRKKGISKPQVAVHQGDADYIGKTGIKNQSEILQFPGSEILFKQIAGELPEADFLLEDGMKIGTSGLKVITCPGHSQGGVCFYQQEEGLLFSGDSLFASGIGRTDFPGGDYRLLIKNIKEKLLRLPETTKVFPGHGQATTIAKEKIENLFLKE